MYAQHTDEVLADLLRKDDVMALETLFTRYYRQLCQFCNIYTRDYPAAEELVADIFIRIWDSRKNREIGKPKEYLFVAAKHSSLNYLQKLKAVPGPAEQLDDDAMFPQDNHTPFHILAGRESYREIFSVIDKLPARQREVLLMSRIENIEKSRIADLLGITVRTVETLLYQSVKQLRQQLRDPQDQRSGG
ncbi:sigma-70 family RNA polymerase sigma factor [Pedobacter sp. JY14-1]|uniref:sigma-70 family RNA polymerase sigma factor n=1 Tax=Pedobacter sp. JY14-1 TaxID=3034151 RepID=UPI0023E331F7|nr:sigma-70 family RNA polymerase sigma factor [Pedobacter sp. JY14-1]